MYGVTQGDAGKATKLRGLRRGFSWRFRPAVATLTPERKALADLEFKNRNASTISDEELLEDRIKSLEMRLAFYKIRIPRRSKSSNITSPTSPLYVVLKLLLCHCTLYIPDFV